MRKQVENDNLRLMVFKSADDLGNKIDEHLLEMYNLPKDEYTFIVHLNSLDKYKTSIDQDTLAMFIMKARVNCCVREEIHKQLKNRRL